LQQIISQPHRVPRGHPTPPAVWREEEQQIASAVSSLFFAVIYEHLQIWPPEAIDKS